MPGFMGLRGMEHKNPRDMERERRADQRTAGSHRGLERRAQEKVQEILHEQEGDMSAFAGRVDCVAGGRSDAIARRQVGKIMTGRVAVLSFDDTLLTVQGIFNGVKFRHLPVVDEDGHILGIISDRDFLRMVSPFFGTINEQNRDKEIMTRKAGMIMTRNPICISPEATVLDAVKAMNHRKISCLPVVEGENKKLLGIVTWKDVVRAFCPEGFNPANDSSRLKTGVHVNPESAESARLKARAAESVRLKAKTAESTRLGGGIKPHPDTFDAVRPGPPKAGLAPSGDGSRLHGGMAPKAESLAPVRPGEAKTPPAASRPSSDTERIEYRPSATEQDDGMSLPPTNADIQRAEPTGGASPPADRQSREGTR